MKKIVKVPEIHRRGYMSVEVDNNYKARAFYLGKKMFKKGLNIGFAIPEIIIGIGRPDFTGVARGSKPSVSPTWYHSSHCSSRYNASNIQIYHFYYQGNLKNQCYQM